ncbi:MAG: hypothetical protein IT280_12125 [Ignavibacteria bacterium]|nr:hypothetical protein [Ignavibacteria bacterium]
MNPVENKFIFYSEFNLPILLGISAKNVNELLEHLKTIPESSVYFHTHRFLVQHIFLVPEPPNDFAYWLRNILNLRELSEHVSSVDITSAANINDLRKRIIASFENYKYKDALCINCTPGDEFRFMSCKTFCLPLGKSASNIKEFLEIFRTVSLSSLYFHIFGAQLRKGQSRNDFAEWFDLIGENELAAKIASIDPYTSTLEGLRSELIEIISSYDRSK